MVFFRTINFLTSRPYSRSPVATNVRGQWRGEAESTAPNCWGPIVNVRAEDVDNEGQLMFERDEVEAQKTATRQDLEPGSTIRADYITRYARRCPQLARAEPPDAGAE